jgi:NhaP-type Na+/H+ or K+/H+ antiporter
MLDFQERGLGTNKGIPTLFIASSSFDNIIAITGHSVMIGIVFNQSQLWWTIVKSPIQIIIGIIAGILIGCLLNIVRLSHTVSLKK